MRDILVVDDDPDIRDALQLTLEAEGYRVRTAADGAEALDRLEQDPAALVLLDLMMPVMGGAEFMERVRSDPRLGTLPVLVVTAWPKDAAALPGVRGVLKKPVDIDELFAQVARFVGESEAR